MREVLAVIGPLISVIGFLPYLKQTINGTVKPRIASWATWSLVAGIATIAELSHRSYTSAFLTGMTTLFELSILLMALRHGEREYGWIDGTSQTISLVGLTAWLITRNPVWAIVFNVLADFFGAVPTFYHSWISPHHETWQPYILSGVGASLSFLAVKDIGFISAGFPIYLTLIGYALGINILVRQKIVKQA